ARRSPLWPPPAARKRSSLPPSRSTCRQRPRFVRGPVLLLVAVERVPLPDLHEGPDSPHHRLAADAHLRSELLPHEKPALVVQVHRLGVAEEHPGVGSGIGSRLRGGSGLL